MPVDHPQCAGAFPGGSLQPGHSAAPRSPAHSGPHLPSSFPLLSSNHAASQRSGCHLPPSFPPSGTICPWPHLDSRVWDTTVPPPQTPGTPCSSPAPPPGNPPTLNYFFPELSCGMLLEKQPCLLASFEIMTPNCKQASTLPPCCDYLSAVQVPFHSSECLRHRFSSLRLARSAPIS